MRKKKHPRMPNGFGQIRQISGAKRNPYGVYPPQLQEDQDGKRLPVQALCYVPTWSVAFAVLAAYNAGTYVPGMESDLINAENETGLKSGNNRVIEGILADYMRIKRKMEGLPEIYDPSFAEVYKLYYHDKYETGRVLSKSSKSSAASAFRNCAKLHDRSFRSLRLADLQDVVDTCPLKHSSLELIVGLIKQMYKYADAHELIEKDYSTHLKIKIQDDDVHGVPFTEEELRILWNHSDDPIVEMILIMCYAGYRIAAYTSMQVNLQERYFLGGNKTASGKNLQVPIFSGIYPLVERRVKRDGGLLAMSPASFRNKMNAVLKSLGIERHTPHDCKHTFSALCEQYGVNENDRKRMLGHKIGNVTNDVYGHRTLEELRAEIEKIEIP